MTTERIFTGDLNLRPSGIGGSNDSSSSRESSPELRKRKRTFSDGSIDMEGDIPPIADDDTPPPPERPLIRQAVAFAGATSVTLPASSIYQATIAPNTGKRPLLPGQGPAPTPKPPRRKKKKEDYSGQVGRFRLDGYVSTPSDAIPVQEGTGPYNSAFRGMSRPVRSESPAVIIPHELTASQAPARATRGTPNKAAGRSKAKGTSRMNLDVNVPSSSALPHQMPTPVTDHGASPTPSASGSNKQNHYRLDYETGQTLAYVPDLPAVPLAPPVPEDAVAGASSESRPPSPTRPGPKKASVPRKLVTILAQDIRSGLVDNQLAEVNIPLRPSPNPGEGFYADAKELVEAWQSGAARVDGPARVFALRGRFRQIVLRVTAANVYDHASTNILVNLDYTVNMIIENLPTPGVVPQPPRLPPNMMDTEYAADMRPVHHGQPLPQPPSLRHAQGSPATPISRPSGSDHARSHPQEERREPYYRDHVKSPASRSSDFSPPQRARQSPHQARQATNFVHRVIPQSPPSESPRPSLAALVERSVPPREEPTSDTSPRSPTSGPRIEEEAAPAAETSLQQIRLEHYHTQAVARERRNMGARKNDKGYETPNSGDETSIVDEAIRKAVDGLIQKDDKTKWSSFFRSKAQPETASVMYDQYQYVQGLFDKYVGQPVPFRSRADIIMEEKHILAALYVEDDDGKYASRCKETLTLYRLYGKGGERCEDPGVLELMAQTDVEYNAKPIKRLLHMLRDIDKKWMSTHPRI